MHPAAAQNRLDRLRLSRSSHPLAGPDADVWMLRQLCSHGTQSRNRLPTPIQELTLFLKWAAMTGLVLF